MGIFRFVGTLLKHPVMIGAISDTIPSTECLMTDYNASIHYILQKTITTLNQILYFRYKNMLLDSNANYFIKQYQLGTTYDEIKKFLSNYDNVTNIVFNETIKYTQDLITNLNQHQSIKSIYFALDGVPSMAKMKEQKNRRYVGSYINQIKCDLVKKYVYGTDDIMRIDIFHYRSMICAGTNFMERIEEALYNLPQTNIKIEVSGVKARGEGEKKIITAIEESDCLYGSYCIMSPDSDMIILISLLSHQQKFQGKKIYNFRIDYQNEETYQFIDMGVLLENMQSYFSGKVGTKVQKEYLLGAMFMLLVFGNDFLPKIEPLNMCSDFDLVMETALGLACEGYAFSLGQNQNLNYAYLLEFFRRMEFHVLDRAVHSNLDNTYHNYTKLKNNLELTALDLVNSYHHPNLVPIQINYLNILGWSRLLTESFKKFINYMKNTQVNPQDIEYLYYDIHREPIDSYMLLVMPRIVKFDNELPKETDPLAFFKQLVEFIQRTKSFSKIQFNLFLQPRRFDTVPKAKYQTNWDLGLDPESEAFIQIEKLDRSLEPYRSMFKVEPINLVKYDLFQNKLVDLRPEYYQMYCELSRNKKTFVKEKISMVENYLVGIEWLYQYYIKGAHLEYSGWFYHHTHPPLVVDIVHYLSLYPKCQPKLTKILNSYPPNNLTPIQNYLTVTPNDYTQANLNPNISDIKDRIDGYGAMYINRAQVKWNTTFNV